MKTVDPSLRSAIRAEIERDYGEHTIMPANRMPKVRRMPSGSLALNYIMGGGYAFGAMTRLWGAFSTGKSSAIFNAFRQAQMFGELRYEALTRLAQMASINGDMKDAKKFRDQAKREREQYADGLKCLYVGTEGIFDAQLALRLGVKIDGEHLELAFSRRIEEIGDIVQKALLGYHVVAVDSTTGTMSIEELASDKGEKTVYDASQTTGMTRARKWGYNMDWWQDRMSSDNVLIFTSQIQTKIGMTPGQRVAAEKAPGGEKLNHEAGVILHFMKGGWLKRKADGGLAPVGDQGGEKGAFGKAQAAGGEVIIRCDKNKTAKSHRIALLHHDKNTANWDSLFEYEKLAKYYRVVQPTSEGSSWYKLPNGEKTQSLRRELEENGPLVRAVEQVVMRCSEDPVYEAELLRSKGGPGDIIVEGLDS